MTTSLDLNVSMPELTRTLLDIYSVSGEEKTIADAVYEALSAYPHLHLTRDGDAMIARTEFGPRNGEERTRILLAGHLDTVPLPTVAGSLGTVPARIVEDNGDWVLYGRGATDMKGGVAVQLKLAAELGEHDTDYNLTYVFYDHEEVASELSGMARLIRNHGELAYREGLNAVQVSGGVAGNVIPDAAALHINYRFAPNKTLDEAKAHVTELFNGYELDFVDLSPAARPGLDTPLAASLIAAVGQEPKPKYGWTDVARLSEIGIPAVNFGPGDALLAHTDNEHVSFSALTRCYTDLLFWLHTEVDED